MSCTNSVSCNSVPWWAFSVIVTGHALYIKTYEIAWYRLMCNMIIREIIVISTAWSAS